MIMIYSEPLIIYFRKG